MTEYFLRLLILVPLVGGLAWGSLWLWKRVQLGLPAHRPVDRPAVIVDVLTMGTSGKLAVVAFGGKTLLVAASRQGISLIAESDGISSMRKLLRIAIVILALVPAVALAQAAAPVVAPGGLESTLGKVAGGQQSLSLSLQILILMSLLTVLPSLILMMTSFTRIIIVLSILRQALGLQQTPPNQVLVGLSLFLSLFIMAPVLNKVNTDALQPYNAGTITLEQGISKAGEHFHGFMVGQTRKTDLAMFQKLAKVPPVAAAKDIPFTILLPAFVTSELKTAFQIGFLIFLPFLVIDLIVASALMSLGMMMLSPTIISMPFKLLLFVLVDGWALTMGSLAASFGAG